MNFKNTKRRKGVSLIIIAFSLVVLLVFTGFAIDIGVILNVQSELQKAVETSVLRGASSYGLVRSGDSISLDTQTASTTTSTIFNSLCASNNLISSPYDTKQEDMPTSEAVKINTKVNAMPIFMSLIGIKNITLEAQASAVASPFYLSKSFPRGISSGSLMTDYFGDSEAKDAVGDNKNLNGDLTFEPILGPPDSRSVSLGAFGYVTVRLPMPLVDGNGFDLFISESGNLDGYMVYAGNDNDPDDPYFNEINPGAGITWSNISQYSAPVNVPINEDAGAYSTNVTYMGTTINEPKMYGSGLFDIGEAGLSCVKYIKIVDDGKEDGFLKTNTTSPTIFIGDHSSVTPGADIDAIAVLHHSKLIPYNDVDADGDGLLNSLEDIITTNPGSSDSDGDGVDDNDELFGYSTAGSSTVYITGANDANSNKENSSILIEN